MGRLEGKVAIITGAAGGQGEAEARLFISEGAKVILTDINDRGAAIAEELGENALFALHDVSREAAWERVVAQAIERFAKIDVLVNNAAVYRPRSFMETDRDLMDYHYSTNQLGVFLGMKAVLGPMSDAGGGSIVNISSIAGLRATPESFAYACSKWAVRGMTKCAALDLATRGIRVNSIHPGVIDTPMLDEHPPEYRKILIDMTPCKRIGAPSEVAQAVLFLASDAASYVSGAELAVSYGIT